MWKKAIITLDYKSMQRPECTNKDKAHERHTIRPQIDQQAAERFVKHGIQYREQKPNQPPPNKKIKFSD
ncbi:hypothetical protein NQ317_009243 [Molorchus minor]|uniref:Uncharacterized protein n=1 Tax=Molorchus minor TaxID=1323400 RepID=A0ABQ9JCY2_9CUCU|nr:hypothetical protein NQ317_009243 [Molorchus minor]